MNPINLTLSSALLKVTVSGMSDCAKIADGKNNEKKNSKQNDKENKFKEWVKHGFISLELMFNAASKNKPNIAAQGARAKISANDHYNITHKLI